jgi:hypothetical protein
MATAIVYKTIYGSTAKYTKWLGESVKADIYDMGLAKTNILKDYDTIIVMSGTYAGRMEWVNYLKKNWDILGGKEIIAISVGAVPINHLWSRINYFLIPGNIKRKIKYFKIYSGPETEGNAKKECLNPIIKYLQSKN